MEREFERDDDLVDLGRASTETQSGGGQFVDLIGPAPKAGISDEE